MLNFEPHKPTYKISIEVGRSVVNSENTTHDYSPHTKAFGNKEWWNSRGRGWFNTILLSQLHFLESYKPMHEEGNNVMDSLH